MTRPPDDLPGPAPKLVWLILDYHGPLSKPELANRFNIPRSTVQDSVDYLEHEGYVDSEFDTNDIQTRRYRLKSEYRNETMV